jgi:hypothetical protein
MCKLAKGMDKIKIEDKAYLSINDYAETKSISRKTVYNRIEAKKLTTKRILNRTFILIEG